MARLKTPLEVYKLLPRTNCGGCGISTCMAFAACVIKQEKKLSGCPHLAKDMVREYEGHIEGQVNLERIQEEKLRELQSGIASMDLPARAPMLGGRVSGASLVIRCLGRDFEVDCRGAVSSPCHTHAWFSIPLLDHILVSNGSSPNGRWVPLRELPNGQTWSRLFEQRCEKPLKQLADAHGDLFEDLISMFSGRATPATFNSDISVVLYPLPRVPVLVCYWKREEDMESKLHLFFDDTAESHLHIDSLFTLATGIVMMLEKIMRKHSDGKSVLP
ncbi:MAG: Fe-S cluster protein [Nitrospirae bacterium GWD2_57_9]|nr:MAG: Fe-S cluster protein [Nitrospirae bacterium GWD2_57_9]OGW49981.1 MAG: Fe-S cluster protein [Nitrospirae bacterium GWC2_57_9]